jgi:hypothetical protein
MIHFALAFFVDRFGSAAADSGAVFERARLLAWLETLAALALVLAAAALLAAAWRVSRGVEQLVGTCLERQKTEARLVEMLGDYAQVERSATDQLWSASTPVSAC